MTQAEQFKKAHAFQTENNGWTGEDISRHPSETEAKEIHEPSAWGWLFPDGSELWVVPGQVSTSVYTNLKTGKQ